MSTGRPTDSDTDRDQRQRSKSLFGSPAHVAYLAYTDALLSIVGSSRLHKRSPTMTT